MNKKEITYSASARAFQAFKEDFEEYKRVLKDQPQVSAWDTLNFCKTIEKKKILVFKTQEL